MHNYNFKLSCLQQYIEVFFSFKFNSTSLLQLVQFCTFSKGVNLMSNLEIWQKVETTDPKFTKNFNRSGGFAGTAINPTYLANKATEVFGPIGIGWGINIIDERYAEGAPIILDKVVVGKEVIHIIRASLWYVWNDKKGEVIQYGQTTFVGKNKYGPFTDEEAPKKSLTDAMSKCLSLLGFSADIHTGHWDDNKYVSKKEESAPIVSTANAPTNNAAQAKVPTQSTPPKADVPVNSEREAQVLTAWEQRILQVTQKADLDNAMRMVDQTFKCPAINAQARTMIQERIDAFLTV